MTSKNSSIFREISFTFAGSVSETVSQMTEVSQGLNITKRAILFFSLVANTRSLHMSIVFSSYLT